MKITRQYKPTNINWKLFPTILEKVRASIPESERKEPGMGDELVDIPRFELRTFSQEVSLPSVDEFLSFKPGILGDIEYIRFPRGHIGEAVTPILEGLRELGFTFS